MQRLATLLMAACALALTLVAIAPDQTSAGWRRGWGYYGPGVGVYAGPGYGYYGYRYRPYGYYGGVLSLLLRPLLAAGLVLLGARRSRVISGGGDGPLAYLNPCEA
jgi:hypothetical protein